MLEGIMIGLSAALSIQNLLMVIAGCLIGTFIGMLPGLGPMSIIAIMIPVAITLGDPTAALILLAGVYYGAIFGGSTSSILLNAPGVAGTVATSFDGYPMARKGQAGKALTIAAVASFAGGTIGAILLMIFAPALSSVALLFHSAEYFALMVVGLSAIAAFAGTGQVAKALMMTILGLILATVGEGALFNMPRFTLGMMDLQSGISFITLAMAMFALPEALFLVLNPARGANSEDGASNKITGLRFSREEAKAMAPVIGRQSVQGFFIGVLPGGGCDDSVISWLCCGTQSGKRRRTGRIWQGLGQRSGCTGNRQQRRVHRIVCAAAHPGHTRIGNNGHPAGRAHRAERDAGTAPDDRHTRGVLGCHHLHVYRQSCSFDPEPAIDPLHRQDPLDSAQLSDPVHPLFHFDGGLYRAEQCDRAADPGWAGRDGNYLPVCGLPTGSIADRVYSWDHA